MKRTEQHATGTDAPHTGENTTGRITGPAAKTTARVITGAAAVHAFSERDVTAIVAAHRATGQRGNTARRPSRRQIRAALALAAMAVA